MIKRSNLLKTVRALALALGLSFLPLSVQVFAQNDNTTNTNTTSTTTRTERRDDDRRDDDRREDDDTDWGWLGLLGLAGLLGLMPKKHRTVVTQHEPDVRDRADARDRR